MDNKSEEESSLKKLRKTGEEVGNWTPYSLNTLVESREGATRKLSGF